MQTQTLWVPETAVKPLFMWTANDMIVCEAHTHSTDWSFDRLSVEENREYRAFVDENGWGDPCEMCRVGVAA